jgi:hypothetical protein
MEGVNKLLEQPEWLRLSELSALLTAPTGGSNQRAPTRKTSIDGSPRASLLGQILRARILVRKSSGWTSYCDGGPACRHHNSYRKLPSRRIP